MPYTAQQLSTFYTGLTGTAPDQATQVLFQAYAQQNANGSLTDAQTLAFVFNAPQVQATFEVAVSTYQFFTGTTLSAGGIAYLRGDAGSGNTQGLNNAFYTQFNTENRYYNFAINLSTGAGAGAASFAATYGATSITPTTPGGLSPYIQAVYEVIIGSSNVGTTAANAAIADITSRLAFFQNIAATRGGDASALTNPNGSIVLKAVIAGYLLEEANKADVGTYARAIDQFEASIAQGNAIFGPNQNLITNYSQGGAGFGTGVGQNTSGTGGVNGGGSGTNLTPNVETLSGTTFNGGLFFNAPSGTFIQTLNTGDVLNATGSAGATLNVTFQNFGTTQTVTPTLNGISTINVSDLDTTNTATTLDLFNSTGVANVNIQNATGNIVIANNKSALTSLTVANTAGGATPSTVTVQSTAQATVGTADTLALNLGSNINGGAITANGYEIVNLNSTGTNNATATTQIVNFADTDLRTLNVSGTSAQLNLTGFTAAATAPATTTITTLNASTYTGALTVGSFGGNTNFNATTNVQSATAPVAAQGLGASVLTFTGSTGADTLVLGAGLTAADTINGNGGADVLGILAVDNPAAALNITNIPTITFYTAQGNTSAAGAVATAQVFAAGGATVNRAFFGTAANTINLGAGTSDTGAATGTDTIAVTNLVTGNTVGFDYDAGTQTAAGGVVNGETSNAIGALRIALTTDGTADSATINFRNTDTASSFAATGTLNLLTATGFETLNLNLTGGAGTVNALQAAPATPAFQNTDTLAITAIQDAQLSLINVTGATNLTLTSTGGTSLNALTAFNASTATGIITLGTAANPFTTANTGAIIATGTQSDFISLNTQGTGVLNTINMGGQQFGPTATGLGTAAAPVVPVFTDFGNALVLTNTAGVAGVAGVTVVDLSSTTDQITQLLGGNNIAANQLQTGISSIDLSRLGAGAGGVINTAQVTGDANANYIITTAGVDVISSGAGNDVIQAGGAGDNINVGTGTDTVRFVALADSVFDAGGTGTVFTNAGTTANIDKVVGLGGGDRLDFSGFAGGASVAAQPSGTIVVGNTYITDGGADTLVRGNYDATAQTFTASATGADLLFQHDTNGGGNGTGIVDVVLVGSAATITSFQSTTGGFYTFTGTAT